jgi:hypothetical protein
VNQQDESSEQEEKKAAGKAFRRPFDAGESCLTPRRTRFYPLDSQPFGFEVAFPLPQEILAYAPDGRRLYNS